MWEQSIFTKVWEFGKDGAAMVKKHYKNGLMLGVFFAGNVFPREKHWGHCFRTASSAGDEHPGDGGECIGEYSCTALRGELGTGIRLGRNAAQRYGFLGQIKGI